MMACYETIYTQQQKINVIEQGKKRRVTNIGNIDNTKMK
jgi:hypothetical protein